MVIEHVTSMQAHAPKSSDVHTALAPNQPVVFRRHMKIRDSLGESLVALSIHGPARGSLKAGK